MSFNKITLVGNLGRDPELRYTPQGTPVCSFSLATNERRKDRNTGENNDITTWFRVTLWGRQAETASQYLTRGRPVYIEGRLQTRNYENKEGRKVYVTEVVAEELILLGGKQGGADSSGEYSQQPVSMPRSAQKPQAAAAPAEDPGFDQGITDDDVPF